MQEQNIREYELVRNELVNIRTCITNYIGFVIGGSGVGFAGLIYIAKCSTGSLMSHVGIPLVLATLITMVQMILYYKFLSHNRYAGYCKLLNHESYNNEGKYKDIILWEACMDTLRKSDFNSRLQLLQKALMKGEVISLCDDDKYGKGTLIKRTGFLDMINKISRTIVVDEDQPKGKNIYPSKLKRFFGMDGHVDKGCWRLFLGFKYLRAIIGTNKADTWPFPALVNAIFILLTPLFSMYRKLFLIYTYKHAI